MGREPSVHEKNWQEKIKDPKLPLNALWPKVPGQFWIRTAEIMVLGNPSCARSIWAICCWNQSQDFTLSTACYANFGHMRSCFGSLRSFLHGINTWETHFIKKKKKTWKAQLGRTFDLRCRERLLAWRHEDSKSCHRWSIKYNSLDWEVGCSVF